MKYTKQQETAINHRRGNLLILACAGSGKTEVISRRIAHLVEEGIPKPSIVAFTFTDRAAGELKNRIRKHLEDLLPDDPSLGDMYVGTIHGFCLQLLREIDPQYRKFEVMDDARQAALIMTRFYRFQDSEHGMGLQNLRAQTRGGGYWETVRTFVNTLNVMHQAQIEPDSLPEENLRDAIERYRKTAYGYPNYFLDFNEIISSLIERLQDDPGKLNSVHSRFKYLIVDEYQDVDRQQEKLISLLTGGGQRVFLTVVGDDDQAIYGWRGAQIDNILQFKKRYPDVTEVKLEYNFRSTHAVVDIANSAIRLLPPGRRIAKAMEARHWSSSDATEPQETLAESGDIQVREFPSEEAEALWVADRISDLRGTLIKEHDGTVRGIDFADMAILLRSVKGSGSLFAHHLRQRKIPSIVRGIGGLFDHPEVLLIQAALSFLARQDFVLRVGDEYRKLQELETRQYIRNTIRELRKRGSMPTADDHVFLGWLAGQREELDRRNLEKEARGRLSRRIYPQVIFQNILSALGSAVGPKPWPADVLYNLGRLSALITQFEAVHQWITPKDLSALCLFLGGWAAGQVDEGGLNEIGTPNAVQIMTVHAAKGLEWPVVFLPRISSSNFPSSFRNRGPVTFLSQDLFQPETYAVGDEGERRLWYVALTRCRKFLHISSPNRPRKKPTEYLKEIKHDYVQRQGPIKDRPKGKPSAPANIALLPTTHTALSYFWRCPFEYQLRELMGFSPGVSESYGYGQQIHNILAEIHKLTAKGEHLDQATVDRLVEERFHLRYTRDGDTLKPFTLLRNAARDSIRRYMDNFPDSSKLVLEAEKPFEFLDRESGALISGTIDLLQRIDVTSEGEQRTPVAVVEFKAHRFKDLESYERRREDVDAQLRLYTVAVGKALGFEASKAFAHFLSPRGLTQDLIDQGVSESIEVDVSHERQNDIQEKVRAAVRGIRSAVSTQDFPLHGCDKGACKRCDYKLICPGATTWRARDRTTPRPLSPEEERSEEMILIMEELNAGPET